MISHILIAHTSPPDLPDFQLLKGVMIAPFLPGTGKRVAMMVSETDYVKLAELRTRVGQPDTAVADLLGKEANDGVTEHQLWRLRWGKNGRLEIFEMQGGAA